MKNALLPLVAALFLGGCTSFEYISVSPGDFANQGGEAKYLMQADVVGLTAIFHIIDIVPASLDDVVNKVLVAQAKQLGASKVILLSASTTPRHGVFALTGTLIGFPSASAVGIAVK